MTGISRSSTSLQLIIPGLGPYVRARSKRRTDHAVSVPNVAGRIGGTPRALSARRRTRGRRRGSGRAVGRRRGMTPPPMTNPPPARRSCRARRCRSRSQRPRRPKMSCAFASPCCAAAVTVCPVTSPSLRPSTAISPSGSLAAASRPIRVSAVPDATASRQPGPPAAAARAERVDDHVAELAAHAGRAAVDLPVEHEAAPDAGADGQEQHVLVDALAEPCLGEPGDVRVVVDDRRQPGLPLELVADRPVAVGVVGRPQHAPVGPAGDPGRADADRRDVAVLPQPRHEIEQDGGDDDGPGTRRGGLQPAWTTPLRSTRPPAIFAADVDPDRELGVPRGRGLSRHACMMPSRRVCHHHGPGTARHAPSPSCAPHVGRDLHSGRDRRPPVPPVARAGGEARPRRRQARARTGHRRRGADGRQGRRGGPGRPAADELHVGRRRAPHQDRRRRQGRRGHDAGPGQGAAAGVDGPGCVADPDDRGRAPLLGGDRRRGQDRSADQLLQEHQPARRPAHRRGRHRGQALARVARAQGREPRGGGRRHAGRVRCRARSRTSRAGSPAQ